MLAEVTFGEWLKRRRGSEGWTQKQLAQQLNCSISSLRKMEAEERRPSVQVIQQLIEIFKIPQNERKSFQQFARGDWGAFSGGETESGPWYRSRDVQRTNLPESISSFIGREKEIEEISQLISKNRLVTIAGVGGIGKTRLAIKVGQRLLDDHPDGVWFVTFDSLTDPALVVQTTASVFGIREGSSDQPVIERLKFSLHTKRILLILDNCEHVLNACVQLITTLLQNCPNLRILSTSRAILNITGEATFFLPVLSLPEQDSVTEELAEYESVQLFVERSVLSRSSFKLTRENASAVLNICRRVDGIPLALELAAARVDILRVEEIRKQLDNSFALLKNTSWTSLPRHQTIQTLIDWSWRLLSETERIFMRQLSVFAGGWTLDSAQAVCEGDALSLTSALVKKSLMVVDQESGHKTRYRFHEIVRQYTREKLGESGEEADVRTRHLKYFLQLAEYAESALRGSTQMEWYLRLQHERNNLRVALEWADQTDTEAGLHISGRLHRFWENFDLREGRRWLDLFLENPESKNFPLARANALYTKTWLLHWAQKSALALPAAQECLELYVSCGNKPGEIDGLVALVLLAPATGNVEGIELYQRALTLSESLGDPWKQAQVLFQSRFLTLNDYHHNSYLAKSVTFFKKAGDWELAIQPMLWLATEAMTKGDFPSAQQWLDQAVQASHEVNHKGLKSLLFLSRGSMELLRGEYEKARVDLEEAIQLYGDLGNRLAVLWARVRLGYVAVRQGELTKARHLLKEAARDFRESQGPSGVVFALEGMANLYTVSGQYERAAWLIGWADAMRKVSNNGRQNLEQADVDKIIATCLAKMGEVAFSDAYDEGKEMSLDKAVAYAIEENK